MSYVQSLFKTNFLEYASYVIKERAIPDLEDGLKPVQRRILHSLLEIDDGKFHKVANVVGHCMKYHPHGDTSIYEALVNLANHDLFIDKQGNFGNKLTGDEASAARYIECRALPFAKKVLYNPELTPFTASYDGRNKEPRVFPAKLPIVLIHGAEGIAVGMSTKVLPHNIEEVLEAMKAQLLEQPFQLFPDFPGGGIMDISEYQDGMGRVLVRAKLNTKDPKKITIEEVPFGVTTEKLIASIEAAAKKGKIKLSSIQDYTGEKINIELKLARNTYTKDVVDALYAFTDCEQSISVNLLVIRENMPVLMTVSEIIAYHSEQLVKILRRELENEEQHLREKLHARTLERIFVEERIYKEIEEMKTQELVHNAVFEGFVPYRLELTRDVSQEDIERLLKIPIRRISLYDINKAKKEIQDINNRLKEIKYHLAHIIDYALDSIDGLLNDISPERKKRRTKLISFEKADVREAANRNLSLSYNNTSGYLGYSVSGGKALFSVSHYDRILVIRKDGTYFVMDTPEKYFVGKGMKFCCLADKEVLEKYIFSAIYQDKKSKGLYIKRTQITQYIMNKQYNLVPDGGRLLKLTTRKNAGVHVSYKPKPRLKVKEETFSVGDYLVKGTKAKGVRLTSKEAKSIRMVSLPENGDSGGFFGEDSERQGPSRDNEEGNSYDDTENSNDDAS